MKIILKQHVHLQTMTKTHVKFLNNLHNTVGGVAQTQGTQYLFTLNVIPPKKTKFIL